MSCGRCINNIPEWSTQEVQSNDFDLEHFHSQMILFTMPDGVCRLNAKTFWHRVAMTAPCLYACKVYLKTASLTGNNTRDGYSTFATSKNVLVRRFSSDQPGQSSARSSRYIRSLSFQLQLFIILVLLSENLCSLFCTKYL